MSNTISINKVFQQMHEYDESFRICKMCGMRRALTYNPYDEKNLPNGKSGKPIRCIDPGSRNCPYWISSTKFYDKFKPSIKNFVQRNHRQLDR